MFRFDRVSGHLLSNEKNGKIRARDTKKMEDARTKKQRRIKMTCIKPKTAWRYTYMPLKAKYDQETYDRFNKLHFNKFNTKLLDDKKIELIEIPCGSCIGCKLDKANEWATRMYLEKKQWKNACFITLTYNEKKLPKDKKLHERDMQLFLKRLRKAEKGIEEWINPKTKKQEKPIRYLYCGEYGTKNNRPHYHIALFNYIPNDLKPYKKSDGSGEQLYTSTKIYKIWGKGFCPIGQMTYKSACYIARYVQKKIGTGSDEFIRMSRMPGLGITEWENNKTMLKKTGNVIVNIDNKVKSKKIPRYFEKLWKQENWFTHADYKNKIKEKAVLNAIQQKNTYTCGGSIDNRKEIALNTKKTDLMQKAKLLKRKL